MSEKRYQISPIELVQWAEPLLSKEKKPAWGYSEEWLASYEAAAGLRIPAALRDYLLACGQADLNYSLHTLYPPDKDAKPFRYNMTRIYDYLQSDLKWFQEHGEEDYEELARLRALPQERWGEVAGNHLVFWAENQGCWLAAIKAEDLDQPDPVVYFNDKDDMYSWAPFANSIHSFLLSTILENLEEETGSDEIEDPAKIQEVLSQGGVDFQRLCEPYPFPGGRFCHTCLDTGTNTLYVYGEEAENRPANLKVFNPCEED